MTPEAEKRLLDKYPKIFAGYYLPMTETAMCWGVDCGDGWYVLIDQLCSALQWDTDHNREPQIVATQVKEKFGTLNFYTQGATDKQFGMIKMVEYLSSTVCERCGANGATTSSSTGWLTTLCPKCRADKTEQY